LLCQSTPCRNTCRFCCFFSHPFGFSLAPFLFPHCPVPLASFFLAVVPPPQGDGGLVMASGSPDPPEDAFLSIRRRLCWGFESDLFFSPNASVPPVHPHPSLLPRCVFDSSLCVLPRCFFDPIDGLPKQRGRLPLFSFLLLFWRISLLRPGGPPFPGLFPSAGAILPRC